MGTCLPAVTEALAATPGVASSAGKTWPYWQIPQSACSVTRGYGFHTVEVNHTHTPGTHKEVNLTVRVREWLEGAGWGVLCTGRAGGM